MVFFPEGSDDSTSTPGHWHPCQTISFSTPWGAYNTSFGYRSADVLINHISVHSPDLYLFKCRYHGVVCNLLEVGLLNIHLQTRPGIELTTFWSRVRLPIHSATEAQCKCGGLYS